MQAWIAFTGEVETMSDDRIVLRAGDQTYFITNRGVLKEVTALNTTDRVRVIGLLEHADWSDPQSWRELKKTDGHINVTAVFAQVARPGQALME